MIQTIFGSPVVVLKGTDVEKVLPGKIYNDIEAYLMLPENKFVNHPDTRGGQICTTDLSADLQQDTIKGVNDLIEYLRFTALDYADLFTNSRVKDLEFSYYWINLTFQGCEIRNHTDKNADHTKRLVITFYPKAPKDGAELVFIHNSQGDEWVSDCDDKDLIKIKLDQGDMVIIDTYTLHAVSRHSMSESRMCIAVEFKIIE